MHVATLAAANTPAKAIPYLTKRLSVAVPVEELHWVTARQRAAPIRGRVCRPRMGVSQYTTAATVGVIVSAWSKTERRTCGTPS